MLLGRCDCHCRVDSSSSSIPPSESSIPPSDSSSGSISGSSSSSASVGVGCVNCQNGVAARNYAISVSSASICPTEYTGTFTLRPYTPGDTVWGTLSGCVWISDEIARRDGSCGSSFTYPRFELEIYTSGSNTIARAHVLYREAGIFGTIKDLIYPSTVASPKNCLADLGITGTSDGITVNSVVPG